MISRLDLISATDEQIAGLSVSVVADCVNPDPNATLKRIADAGDYLHQHSPEWQYILRRPSAERGDICNGSTMRMLEMLSSKTAWRKHGNKTMLALAARTLNTERIRTLRQNKADVPSDFIDQELGRPSLNPAVLQIGLQELTRHLSHDQFAVAELLALGFRQDEIARKLSCSPKKVKRIADQLKRIRISSPDLIAFEDISQPTVPEPGMRKKPAFAWEIRNDAAGFYDDRVVDGIFEMELRDRPCISVPKFNPTLRHQGELHFLKFERMQEKAAARACRKFAWSPQQLSRLYKPHLSRLALGSRGCACDGRCWRCSYHDDIQPPARFELKPPSLVVDPEMLVAMMAIDARKIALAQIGQGKLLRNQAIEREVNVRRARSELITQEKDIPSSARHESDLIKEINAVQGPRLTAEQKAIRVSIQAAEREEAESWWRTELSGFSWDGAPSFEPAQLSDFPLIEVSDLPWGDLQSRKFIPNMSAPKTPYLGTNT